MIDTIFHEALQGIFDLRPSFESRSSMSGLDFGHASSNLHGERNLIDLEGIQPRFFQKQTAAEGGCIFRSFNNAVGKKLITKAMIRAAHRKEQQLFQRCPQHCPIPGPIILVSVALLERLARNVGYSLKKVSAGRSPQEKFEWMLTQTKGRFILVTITDNEAHARDGHNLVARNHHHWIAVSADEKLVIDSLARRLGPQELSVANLERSVRDGILRIYEISGSRHRFYGK